MLWNIEIFKLSMSGIAHGIHTEAIRIVYPLTGLTSLAVKAVMAYK